MVTDASSFLGSVAVSTRAALLRQIAPREARDAGNGRSLAKSRNDAWRNLPRNPKGRDPLDAGRAQTSTDPLNLPLNRGRFRGGIC